MSLFKNALGSVCVALLILATRPLYAIPVVDAGAIAQLVEQINYWKQQIQGMTDQLTQLKASYDAMTGPRGMQNLLALSPEMRNYLPSDWRQLSDALQGLSSAHAALGSRLRHLVETNAVLTPEQLNAFPPEVRASLEAERRSLALRQATTRSALETTSGRFQSIQKLINAIGTAHDTKAVFDLQARIQAEMSMLQNEQTKLEILEQLSQAEQAVQRQRDWENSVAGHGRFATRFQPQP